MLRMTAPNAKTFSFLMVFFALSLLSISCDNGDGGDDGDGTDSVKTEQTSELQDESGGNPVPNKNAKKDTKQIASVDNSKSLVGRGGTNYDFPEKTQIEPIKDEACYDGAIDLGIGFFSDLSEKTLNQFSDEITPEDEKDYGKQIHDAIKDEFKFFEDSRTQLLRNIVKKMKPYVARKEINYQIFLVESPDDPDMLNAFTITGGYIYVTTAMYDYVDSEDELAAIIGHEIGHNENYHCRKNLQKENIAGRLFNENGTLVTNVVNIIFTAYGQPDELESDRAGVYLSYKAGYDPMRGLDFWEKLSEYETESKVGKVMRSHPYSSSRYNCLLDYMNNARTN